MTITAQGTLDLLTVGIEDYLAHDDQWVGRFLEQHDWRDALAVWLKERAPEFSGRHELQLALSREIARIDQRISELVNLILHQESFQKLESSWRGLDYLVEHTAPGGDVEIMLLNLSWRELARDVDGAMDYTQTLIYRRVHAETFDAPGGKPFGILVCDYYVRHKPDELHTTDDLAVIRTLADIGAESFMPILLGVAPQFLGLDAFTQLDRPDSLLNRTSSAEYGRWNEFRRQAAARFVSLTLPRISMRRPWRHDGRRADGFVFSEATGTPAEALWGNSVWALASVLVRSFEQTGWYLDTRGSRDDGGGVIEDLPVAAFDEQMRDLMPRPAVEAVISERRERELGDLGLIPVCPLRYDCGIAFYSSATVHLPRPELKGESLTSARMSAMLQYVLCVCRIAHFVKLIARDKIGSFLSPTELELELQNWLSQYVADDENASGTTKSRYPLKQAEVKVEEFPGRPGAYQCIMQLLPHSQWDALTASIQLRTDMRATER